MPNATYGYFAKIYDCDLQSTTFLGTKWRAFKNKSCWDTDTDMFWELITVLRLGFVRKLYKFTRSFINCLFQFLCSSMTLPRADEFSPTPTEIETRIARSVTLCFASLELRSAIARRAITPTSQRHLLRRQEGDAIIGSYIECSVPRFIVTLGSAMKQYTRKRKAIFKNWECKSDALRLGALRVGSLNGAHFRLQSACFWLGRIPASARLCVSRGWSVHAVGATPKHQQLRASARPSQVLPSRGAKRK